MQIQLQQALLKFASEKAHYETQLKQFKTMQVNQKKEIQDLYQLLDQRKKDFSQVMHKLHESTEMNQQINKKYEEAMRYS